MLHDAVAGLAQSPPDLPGALRGVHSAAGTAPDTTCGGGGRQGSGPAQRLQMPTSDGERLDGGRGDQKKEVMIWSREQCDTVGRCDGTAGITMVLSSGAHAQQELHGKAGWTRHPVSG